MQLTRIEMKKKKRNESKTPFFFEGQKHLDEFSRRPTIEELRAIRLEGFGTPREAGKSGRNNGATFSYGGGAYETMSLRGAEVLLAKGRVKKGVGLKKSAEKD